MKTKISTHWYWQTSQSRHAEKKYCYPHRSGSRSSSSLLVKIYVQEMPSRNCPVHASLFILLGDHNHQTDYFVANGGLYCGERKTNKQLAEFMAVWLAHWTVNQVAIFQLLAVKGWRTTLQFFWVKTCALISACLNNLQFRCRLWQVQILDMIAV